MPMVDVGGLVSPGSNPSQLLLVMSLKLIRSFGQSCLRAKVVKDYLSSNECCSWFRDSYSIGVPLMAQTQNIPFISKSVVKILSLECT